MIQNTWKLTLLAGAALSGLWLQPGSASADIIIERDSSGVPYIYGDTDREMFFGYGYAMAEDRLIQISKLRYLSSGYYPVDSLQKEPKFEKVGQEKALEYRRLYPNLERTIEAEIQELRQHARQDPHSRRAVDALDCVAAGINQFLAEKFKEAPASAEGLPVCGGSAIAFSGNVQTILPEELDYAKKRLAENKGIFVPNWTANDILKIFQNRVMDEFSNRNEEINNLDLLRDFERVYGTESGRRLFNSFKWVADPKAITEVKNFDEAGQISLERASQLISRYRHNQHSTLIEIGNRCPVVAEPAEGSYAAFDQRADQEGFAQNASNFWAFANREASAGKMTAGLFNGPQVGLYDPNSFYSFKIKSGEGFQYAGTSFAGTITTFTGHNGKIATGFTAGNADVADTFCIEVAGGPEGSYTSLDGRLKLVPGTVLKPGNPSLFVDGYNWQVTRFEKNGKGNSVAYIQRHVWQGMTALTFKSFMQASAQTTMAGWQQAMNTVGVNFNMVGASSEGVATMRLTGVVPPRSQIERETNRWAPLNTKVGKPDRYLWDMDVRLPIPASPLDAWHNGKPDFYTLNETTDNGYVMSWNHKPYLLMPDSDLYYDAWYEWDRAMIVEEMLAHLKPTNIEGLKNINTFLSRIDINNVYFRPFLEKLLKEGSLTEDQQAKLRKIFEWNGLRGQPGYSPSDRCDASFKDVSPGQVLFMNWLENFGAEFGALITNGDRKLADRWKPYGKLKQPFYSQEGVERKDPKLDFSTSQNVYIMGKMMLISLKFAFDQTYTTFDPDGWNILLNRPLEGRDRQKTSEAVIAIMLKALDGANEVQMAYPSCYAIAVNVNNAIAMSERDPAALGIPYFRNRGAQNHAVAYLKKLPEVPDSGAMGRLSMILRHLAPGVSGNQAFKAENVTAPGIREYRGFSQSPDQTDPSGFTGNQRHLVNLDRLRDMGGFDKPAQPLQ